MTNDNLPATMPWDHSPSIYQHLQSHIDPATGKLSEEGDVLPDEQRIAAESDLRWAPGALDGVMTHHVGAGDENLAAQQAVDLVLDYCREPTAANKSAVYDCMLSEDIVSMIDEVIQEVTQAEDLNHQRLYELAYSFATEAPDREAVKFGIALLGLFGESENDALFQTLGRHEEFTLFCAVALTNNCDDPEHALWELARHVDGWGRIQVVERLRETENPKIKDWLLRQGYRNSIMYEYLAYTCAVAGELKQALGQSHVDSDLLASAGEIIDALIVGGPAESMDDYDDGAQVTHAFLGHVSAAAQSLDDFLAVQKIKSFLEDTEADWDQRRSRGWSDELRAAMTDTCQEILRQPKFRELVQQGLQSDDDAEFYGADSGARVLGIDTWDYHLQRLQQEPTNSGLWYYALALADDERLPGLIRLASDSIDLSQVATGPADELGLGPEFELHSCLDSLLQKLEEYPGQGAQFIEAGLQSPVVRNRNMAIAALANWDREVWPDSTRDVLAAAVGVEPDDDVRERMTRVLNGQPLESD